MCRSHSIDPVHPANFGRAVRANFPAISVRRIGMRGQSKYHYCGIRLRDFSATGSFSFSQHHQQPQPQFYSDVPRVNLPPISGSASSTVSSSNSASTDHYSVAIVNAVDPREFDRFAGRFQVHCEQVLRLFQLEKFEEAMESMRAFWQSLPKLQSDPLCAWLSGVDGVDYMLKCDSLFWDLAVGCIFSGGDVLKALKSPPSLLLVRTFAKRIEAHILSIMSGNFSPALVSIRVRVARVFSQQLRKSTSLNHLVHSTRSLVQDPSKLQIMLTDWSKLDVASILDQASWVCQCEPQIVQSVICDQFPAMLRQSSIIDSCAEWLLRLTDRFVLDVDSGSRFLLKWNFFTSLIMRDLTLRSAPSFGCYQLLRLFLDEYLYYLVEHKVSAAVP
eukprot:Partr_v1_DN26796_c1_g1_i2_m8604 putative regulatory factor X